MAHRRGGCPGAHHPPHPSPHVVHTNTHRTGAARSLTAQPHTTCHFLAEQRRGSGRGFPKSPTLYSAASSPLSTMVISAEGLPLWEPLASIAWAGAGQARRPQRSHERGRGYEGCTATTQWAARVHPRHSTHMSHVACHKTPTSYGQTYQKRDGRIQPSTGVAHLKLYRFLHPHNMQH